MRMPFTPEGARNAGYRWFGNHRGSSTELFFQKSAKEEGYKKYYINMYFGELPGYGCYVSCECRFYNGDGSVFDVSIGPRIDEYESIEKVEAFFERIYQNMGCVPNKLNN